MNLFASFTTSRFSGGGCRGLSLSASAIVLSAGILTLAGCDHSQDLEERVTQLRKELEKSQSELQTTKQALASAKEELAQAKSASPAAGHSSSAAVATPAKTEHATSAPALPSREVLEDAYVSSAKALRKNLDRELKNFSVTTCTLHNVQMPETAYPVTSAITLSLKSKAGQPYELEFPVKADTKGKWVFPSVDEIVSRIESAKTSVAAATPAPAAAQTPAAAAPAAPAARGRAQAQAQAPAQTTTLGSGVTGGAMPPNSLQEGNATLPGPNNTVLIQWPTAGGGQTTAASSNPAPAAAAQQAPVASTGQPAQMAPAGQVPAQQPQQTPVSAMPSNRDVLIKF
jgi:hypothetical protein